MEEGQRLLVVCTKPNSINTIKQFLQRRKWSVAAYSSVKVAFEAIKEVQPEWILLSTSLPGIQVGKISALFSKFTQATIILFTEGSDNKSVSLLYSHNSFPIIPPPLSGPKILVQVQKIITSRQEASDSPAGATREKAKENAADEALMIKDGGGRQGSQDGSSVYMMKGGQATTDNHLSMRDSRSKGQKDMTSLEEELARELEELERIAPSALGELEQNSGFASGPNSLKSDDEMAQIPNIEPGSRTPQGQGVVIQEGLESKQKGGVVFQNSLESKQTGGVIMQDALESKQTGGVVMQEALESKQSGGVVIQDRLPSLQSAQSEKGTGKDPWYYGSLGQSGGNSRRQKSQDPEVRPSVDVEYKKGDSKIADGVANIFRRIAPSEEQLVEKEIVWTRRLGVVPVKTSEHQGMLLISWDDSGKAPMQFLKSVVQEIRKELKMNTTEDDADLEFFIATDNFDFPSWAKATGEFLINTIHGGIGVGVTFIQDRALFDRVYVQKRGDRFAFPINNLYTAENLDFEIYVHLPQNNKYVKYVYAGQRIGQEQIEGLNRRKVEEFFILPHEVYAYRRYYLTCLIKEKIKDVLKKSGVGSLAA